MERAPEAIYEYQKWRQLAVHDPSAGNFYMRMFWGEMFLAAVVLSLGISIFTGLKQKKMPPRGTSGGSTPR
jgi:hypothetical protein